MEHQILTSASTKFGGRNIPTYWLLCRTVRITRRTSPENGSPILRRWSTGATNGSGGAAVWPSSPRPITSGAWGTWAPRPWLALWSPRWMLKMFKGGWLVLGGWLKSGEGWFLGLKGSDSHNENVGICIMIPFDGSIMVINGVSWFLALAMGCRNSVTWPWKWLTG